MQAIVDFAPELDRLGQVTHPTRMLHDQWLENGAGHRWQYSMMPLAPLPHAPGPVDDRGEIDPGDVTLHANTGWAAHAQAERVAVARLFGPRVEAGCPGLWTPAKRRLDDARARRCFATG